MTACPLLIRLGWLATSPYALERRLRRGTGGRRRAMHTRAMLALPPSHDGHVVERTIMEYEDHGSCNEQTLSPNRLLATRRENK